MAGNFKTRFSTKSPVALIMLEIRKEIDLFEDEIGEELARLGEMGVNAARERGSYTDRTGNLRSSIGYVLARNGEVVTSGEFAKVIGQDNPEGVPVNGDEKGKDMATLLATDLSKDGFALVLVAGMEYASAVSQRGYDVLDSAELVIRDRIDTRFAKLGFGSSETKFTSKDKA